MGPVLMLYYVKYILNSVFPLFAAPDFFEKLIEMKGGISKIVTKPAGMFAINHAV